MRRRLLVVVTMAMVIANIWFFYQKSQSPVPEVLTSSIQTFGGMQFVTGAAVEDLELLRLSDSGTWVLGDEEIEHPRDYVHFTIPNVDGPGYQLWVKTDKNGTFGSFLKIAKSLCQSDIREFLIFDSGYDQDRTEKGLSLTVEKIRDGNEVGYQECRTDPKILQRYDEEYREYEESSASKANSSSLLT